MLIHQQSLVMMAVDILVVALLNLLTLLAFLTNLLFAELGNQKVLQVVLVALLKAIFVGAVVFVIKVVLVVAIVVFHLVTNVIQILAVAIDFFAFIFVLAEIFFALFMIMRTASNGQFLQTINIFGNFLIILVHVSGD